MWGLSLPPSTVFHGGVQLSAELELSSSLRWIRVFVLYVLIYLMSVSIVSSQGHGLGLHTLFIDSNA